MSSELSELIDMVTQKFLYQDFFHSTFAEKLSWACEGLIERDEHPAVRVRELPDGKTVPKNWSEQRAREWFRQDVIGDVIRSDGHSALRYLLGEPGTGKSTLIKFLVNAERQFLSEHSIVISRVEASKLYDFVEQFLHQNRAFDVDLSERRLHSHKAYTDFCTFVVLRDIFFNLDLILYGRFILQGDPLLSSFERVIANIILGALESTEDEGRAHDLFESVTDSLRGRFGVTVGSQTIKYRHHFKDMLEFRPETLNRVLRASRSFLEEKTGSALKVVLVYDGFDLLSPEDAYVDEDKIDLLKSILHNFKCLNKNAMGSGASRVAAARTGLPRDLSQHAIMLMRTNTFNILVEPENRETFIPVAKLDTLGRLSSDVVMFKAFTRASEALGVPLVEHSEQASVSGAFTLIQTLLARMGRGNSDDEKGDRKISNLRIFDGNLRDCFRAVKRLLELIADEAVSDKQIGERPTLTELLGYAESRSASKLAHWRGYRVPEVLLLGHRTYFCNAIRSRSPNSRSRIVKVQSFDSLFDNVFDYLGDLYHSGIGMHNLLIKVRLLQLLNSQALVTLDDMWCHLKLLGYDSSTRIMLDDALLSLRLAGFVFVSTEEGYIEREKIDMFYISNRGRSVINAIVFDPAYMEHVFHSTMFPRGLVKTVNDNTRRDGLDNWASSAIRNYFVMLSYILYLEENIPPNQSVWKLGEEIRRHMVKAVVRIVKADRRKNGVVASRALDLIDKTISDWREQSMVA